MNLFSYNFFALWGISLIIYYTFAKRKKWLLLLFMSLVFYAYSITKVPVVLFIVSVITYFCATWIADSVNVLPGRKRKWCKWVVECACIAALVVGSTTNRFAMLGNSYFTLKAISYLNDVDRDENNCEKNFFWYLLYLIYLPSVLQGPFNRFPQFRKSIDEDISFNYTEFMHGIQRFLWGAFKKLVLTTRLAQMTNHVYSNLESQSGISIIVGTVACSLWLYTDFTGYMDMMLGMSKTFGIALPENFRQPYFSKSVAEFWRRWHITLGTFFRDYIMMPFVQSKQGRALRKHFKKYGKDVGKLVPMLIGTLLVWIATGLWHGLTLRYLAWGMYYCLIISSSLILGERYRAIKTKLHIKEESGIYGMFCMARTWTLVLFANMALQVNSYRDIYTVIRQIIGRSFYNGGYINSSVLNWTRIDVIVLGAGLVGIFAISLAKEKNIDVLVWLDNRILPIRWVIYYILFFSVLLFGMYGSQYDTSQFLYMQF